MKRSVGDGEIAGFNPSQSSYLDFETTISLDGTINRQRFIIFSFLLHKCRLAHFLGSKVVKCLVGFISSAKLPDQPFHNCFHLQNPTIDKRFVVVRKRRSTYFEAAKL